MPWLIYTSAICLLASILVGRRFYILWAKSLLGVLIMVIVDTLGTELHLYYYKHGLLYIGNLPVLHIIAVYATTLLFLNWLPQENPKKILYTLYCSFIFLFLESLMYRAEAIIYPNWQLYYSFFLTFSGLLVLIYLLNLLKNNNRNYIQKSY
ncbi:hypothetical protein Dtox_2948 [Desulfofarcimen acetoxidans DSM 771]|uniref:Uncharacterized protein n=1 Tax=Desulfofarcimen acetoxidans (strain ATCC 49208 / DSM 771 / KCTC 5769 / VKM B-1644 / 5575) TaxID=485916 RepID=C8W2L9_DESAS|nr:hypothetical protein Dtox_2948 [Desulfofarcimen acetoxidans DSM 771]